MAEAPVEIFAPSDREGKPLAPRAALILIYLWKWVPYEEATAYRERKEAESRAPRVRCDVAHLATFFGLDEDTVRAHLRKLQESGWLRRDLLQPGRVALLDRRHRDIGLAKLPGRPEEWRSVNIRDENSPGDRTIKPPGSHDQTTGDRTIKPPGSHDQTTGIARSKDRRHLYRINLSNSNQRAFHAHAHACGSGKKNNLEIALQLVASAPEVVGAARLLATPFHVRHFVDALERGVPSEEIAQVLAAAPAIVAANLQSAGFYSDEMARPGWWSRWRNAWSALQLLSATPTAPRPHDSQAQQTAINVATIDEAMRALGLGGEQ